MRQSLKNLGTLAGAVLIIPAVLIGLDCGYFHRAFDAKVYQLRKLSPEELFTMRLPNRSKPTCQQFMSYYGDVDRAKPSIDLRVRGRDGKLERFIIPGDSTITFEPGCSPDAVRV